MGQRLEKGDVFLLTEGNFVMVGNYYTEVGRVYNEGKNYSVTRSNLKSLICDFLYRKGVAFDLDIVNRFVNFIAKDRPAGTHCLPIGHFIVTRIESRDGTNEETVHCRRYHPEPGQKFDEIHFLQNRHGSGPYRHNVLFREPER